MVWQDCGGQAGGEEGGLVEPFRQPTGGSHTETPGHALTSRPVARQVALRHPDKHGTINTWKGKRLCHIYLFIIHCQRTAITHSAHSILTLYSTVHTVSTLALE